MPTQLKNRSFHLEDRTRTAQCKRSKNENHWCKLCFSKVLLFNVKYVNLKCCLRAFYLSSTHGSRSIADREIYLTLSIFFLLFYEISMNVPAELTIISMEQLIVQIHLDLTSAPASLVTVETGEIIA